MNHYTLFPLHPPLTNLELPQRAFAQFATTESSLAHEQRVVNHRLLRCRARSDFRSFKYYGRMGQTLGHWAFEGWSEVETSCNCGIWDSRFEMLSFEYTRLDRTHLSVKSTRKWAPHAISEYPLLLGYVVARDFPGGFYFDSFNWPNTPITIYQTRRHQDEITFKLLPLVSPSWRHVQCSLAMPGL